MVLRSCCLIEVLLVRRRTFCCELFVFSGSARITCALFKDGFGFCVLNCCISNRAVVVLIRKQQSIWFVSCSIWRTFAPGQFRASIAMRALFVFRWMVVDAKFKKRMEHGRRFRVRINIVPQKNWQIILGKSIDLLYAIVWNWSLRTCVRNIYRVWKTDYFFKNNNKYRRLRKK